MEITSEIIGILFKLNRFAEAVEFIDKIPFEKKYFYLKVILLFALKLNPLLNVKKL